MKTGAQTAIYTENWLYDDLAAQSGLAIILTDEHSPDVYKSNNNSMCEMLYNSAEFAPECDKFCGRAFQMATEANETVAYQCYAGLRCLAVNMNREEKQMVAIIGRGFTGIEDYRQAAARAADGDWQQFPADGFFENVFISNSNESLKKLARQVEQATVKNQSPPEVPPTSEATKPNAEKPLDNPPSELRNPQIGRWRSLFGSLLDLSYRQSCEKIVQFIAERYAVENIAWLEKNGNRLEIIFAKGDLENRSIQFSIAADDRRLKAAMKDETSLELRARTTAATIGEPATIRLFPVGIGDEIQSALVIGGEIGTREKQIARFCAKIASELEILRLRERLARGDLLERAVTRFNENLKNIDSEDFWTNLTAISAELLQAERSSLLVFDEKSDAFIVKAATGIQADFIKNDAADLGERVSRAVLNRGAALVAENSQKIGLLPAPPEWLYKSDSFISYPITIGARKIGILNLTDRADGGVYRELDLDILHSIMPQLAVLIDRANHKSKAGEFEQLSVTDSLTGLLNRRYLEERLTEEIKRSVRYEFPMSFLMIDVDDFKAYNDSFGHTEGDKALQIVGACLKETSRVVDVAARYGGEEFSILLPQTDSERAAAIAERVRERVEKTIFPNRPVTVSIGVATHSLDLYSAKELINAADKALYAAKRNGRNIVRIYENLK